MQNEIDKQIEKLRKQVERYEAKGYFNTAAHEMLANLLKPQAANRPKRENAKQENLTNGKQDL